MSRPHVRPALALATLAAALARCAPTQDLTLRIRPPTDPAAYGALYAPARCIVLAAAPIGSADLTVYATAVRTSQVYCTAQPPGESNACTVRQGLPRCLGDAGEALLEGLSTRTSYLVALVFFDQQDFAATGPLGPGRPLATSHVRHWSVYTIDPRAPPSDYFCLSDPTPSTIFRPVLEKARELCLSARTMEGCTLDFTSEPACRDAG